MLDSNCASVPGDGAALMLFISIRESLRSLRALAISDRSTIILLRSSDIVMYVS